MSTQLPDAAAFGTPSNLERKPGTHNPTPKATTFEPTDPDLLPFVASDYSDFLTGSGADKLADSGVAPLVAAARGYKKIDGTNFAPEMRLMGMNRSTVQGKRLQKSLNGAGNDGLQMPWFSLSDISEAAKKDTVPVPFTYQVRPGRPENNSHGKPVKYEFAAGVGTPLDAHPSVNASWIDNTPIVMIAEGLLKGDSALTSYLHKFGATWDELKDGGEGAAARLSVLLERIPVDERILILSIAGINNTTQNPVDWRNIDFRGREAWIAFDADVGSNIHVWGAASKLWNELSSHEKAGRVRMLSPIVAGSSGSEKTGMDDFLAKVGTWDSLLEHLTTFLPDKPIVDERDVAGDWRISESGLFAEECTAIKDGPQGQISGYHWRESWGIGGRIVSITKLRSPTDEEIRTGIFDATASPSDPQDSRVQIELSWLGVDGETDSGMIEGPSILLICQPADWERKGATFSDNVTEHPSWPPLNKAGEKWVKAMKAHRANEIKRLTSWLQMGWVPQPDGNPAFIVGDQVIGQTTTMLTSSAVNEDVINVAMKFGVGESILDDTFDSPEYKALVRADLEVVIDAYIRSDVFTDRSTAALVLGGALRPVVPLRPRATLFFYGPKGGGKSFAAQRMMGFWERRLGAWSDILPGTAADTIAYIEHCVAHTPIWVADDLAPSAVKSQAEADNAKLATMARNIFNNASKGRMTSNMKTRKPNKPMAQLIITAESELTTPSAKERLIPAYLGQGKLHPDRAVTDHLEKIANEDGVPASLTAHLIKYVLYAAANMDGGWAAYVKQLRERDASLQDKATMMMKEMGASGGSLKRASTLAADVMISLDLLRKLAYAVDAPRETKRLLTDHELIKDLIGGVFAAHVLNQGSSPGKSLIRALSNLMGSGKAHLVSTSIPELPPLIGDVDSNRTLNNMALGWVNNPAGGLRPGGPAIGFVVETATFGPLLMFTADVAFNAAQSGHPELVQHGQQAKVSWAAVWEEKLIPEDVTRRKSKTGGFFNTWKIQGIVGVPISLDYFLKAKDMEGEAHLDEDG
jgi:hypothetical protein